jgi:hypothetical protein
MNLFFIFTFCHWIVLVVSFTRLSRHSLFSSHTRIGDTLQIFERFAKNEKFINDYWQKKPLLITESDPVVIQQLNIELLAKAVDEEFVFAGRGTFQEGKSGWGMVEVSKPRGKSFEDAKLSFEDVKSALEHDSGNLVYQIDNFVFTEFY